MSTTRRAFFSGLAAAALPAAATESTLPDADLARVRIADFADNELALAQMLPHFARIANRVRMEPPDRGFLDISVWRSPKDNRPHNARIMENILSLAWFYTASRSWNPYRGNPDLRARLEAALDFWCGIQDPDGRFSEYGVEQWNLAATAFATKFMGETLRLLKDGPPITASLYERSLAACRKAIEIVLVDEAFWKHGLAYSNQFTNVFAGAPAYFELRPDAALYKRLIRRLEETSTAFQSPCGYFYEADGPDLGYNLGTHHHNVHMAWHYFRKRPEAAIFLRQQDLFGEWLGYNAWPEGENLWALNRSIETRQRHPSTGPVDAPIAERSLSARAFCRSREQVAREAREFRQRMERDWPKTPPLAIGEFQAFTPYAFLHLSQFDWYPSDAERQEAAKDLAARRPTSYIHERMDSRHPAVFHYIKRPTYVAAFASGALIRPQQRLGLTFLWSPKNRTVLQTQTGNAETPRSIEDAVYRINGTTHRPQPGTRDLAHGLFGIDYPLPDGGVKRVQFEDKSIRIEIDRPGDWIENVPLVQGAQELCSLTTEGEVTQSRQLQAGPGVGGKQLNLVTLKGRGKASYRLSL